MRNKANINSWLTYLICIVITLAPRAGWAEIRLNLQDGVKFFDNERPWYWFKVNTHCKFDYTRLFQKIPPAGRFPSGAASLRAAELSFSGGLGKHFSYSTRFDFSLPHHIIFAYLKYSGISKNTSLLLGQILIPSGIENVGSARWSLFLEKSLPSGAFSSPSGLGASIHHIWENITFSAALAHSTARHEVKTHASDPLQQAIRITYSPIHIPEKVIHLGVSVRHTSLKPATKMFSVRPEARGPLEGYLLRSARLNAKNVLVFGNEVAYLRGPWWAQAEYVSAHFWGMQGAVHTGRVQGAYGQVGYVLTGESREYDFKTGTFGRIRPYFPRGAWEIGFRQSYIRFSNKTISGDIACNTGISIGWTMNTHVKIISNYIRARIRRPLDQKRTVDIVGMRVQFVY